MVLTDVIAVALIAAAVIAYLVGLLTFGEAGFIVWAIVTAMFLWDGLQ